MLHVVILLLRGKYAMSGVNETWKTGKKCMNVQ